MKNETVGVGLREYQLPPASFPGYGGRDREAGLLRLILPLLLLPLQLLYVLRVGPSLVMLWWSRWLKHRRSLLLLLLPVAYFQQLSGWINQREQSTAWSVHS